MSLLDKKELAKRLANEEKIIPPLNNYHSMFVPLFLY